MPFTKETKKFLKEAGWYPGRTIETAGYERSLKKGGYPIHPCVLELLRSFGGLDITCRRLTGYVRLDHYHFNPTKMVSRGCGYERSGYDFQVTGRNLCIVGGIWNGYGTLKMDERGGVYVTGDSVFFRVADSGEEAIENLCQGNNGVQLYIPPGTL